MATLCRAQIVSLLVLVVAFLITHGTNNLVSSEPPVSRLELQASRLRNALTAKRSIDSNPPVTWPTISPPLVHSGAHINLRPIPEQSRSVNSSSASLAGFLLADRADLYLNETNSIDKVLADVLKRDGPDMRPSRDYKDFKDISLEVSARAWGLLHDRTQRVIKDRIDLMLPTLVEYLVSSKTSQKCQDALGLTLKAAQRMESWAIKLMNSWGSFPMSGIFEGTYGDPGSFHTCLSISEVNQIDHAHYCSITFRPVMPSRPDYELVVRREPDALLRLFDSKRSKIKTLDSRMPVDARSDAYPSSEEAMPRDAFSDLLEHAQYHHYVYYKLGTCWPIHCTPFDIKRIVKLIAKRNILMHGPVKCYSKNSSDYEDPDVADSGESNLNSPHPTTSNEVSLKRQRIDPSQDHFSHLDDSYNSLGVFASTVNMTGMGTTDQPHKERKRLVISIWDKNDGIFIWKPFFNTGQKIALSIIAVTSAFMLIMTLIDLFWIRMPVLVYKLKLAIHGLPLSTANLDDSSDEDMTQQRSLQSPTPHVSFALCATGKLTTTGAGVAAASRTTTTTTTTDDATATCDPMNDRDMVRRLHARSDCLRPATTSGNLFLEVVDDCSIITNAPQFFRVSEGQMRNDILCLNGIRCITMIWIIMTHTMMYNDWSAFARTRAVEVALKSLFSQPFFNGSYLVDTFFLMSGLLSAFTAFRHSQGLRAKFNSFAYIFGRWLRLTPQIFFVSMIYIVFPSLSSGPHWFPIVGEYSENCISNWWINVLHLQAFYKKHEMCNFVTWWISIDFFYHFFALFVIWVIMLTSHLMGFLSMTGIVLAGVAWQSWRHYNLHLPPNVFSTIPQTGAMWTTMTLDFFWTPYTHAVPFFFGFYIGYLMALKRKLILKQLNTRRALIGWSLSISLLWLQGYSTYWWVTGEADYSPMVSTIFYTVCAIVWAGSLCWIIIASHHGYGGFVNRILSWKVFIVLGKASYLVYLSHFQILFLFFGQQNLLYEPSSLDMVYVIFGNIFFSTLLGIFLCIIYELPWLKMHRRLMKYV